MPTNITTQQNQPAEIKKLRAQRQLNADAKKVAGLQMVLTIALPVAGAVAGLWWPKVLGGVLAFYGIVISVLDVSVLERWQARLRKRAAIIQESFDCSVLGLPWDEMRVGPRPEEEDVHQASSAHRGGKEDVSLVNWYPTAVAEVPPSLGRVICQRANLRWDAQLRRRYRAWLAVALLALGAVVSIIGFRQGASLEQLTLSVLAPIAPMLLWGIREFQKHGEAAETSDRLRERITTVWTTALQKGFSEQELDLFSRQLQGEIYNRRLTAPMIFSWVYWLLRSSGEEQMNVAAGELVKEAKRCGF
jgi:hypothetical protein